jgi:hypothetical protein
MPTLRHLVTPERNNNNHRHLLESYVYHLYIEYLLNFHLFIILFITQILS